MSRLTTMSPDAIKAVFSADSDSDLITLLTFYDPDTNLPSVRLCDNYLTRISETADDVTYGVTSRTNNFIFLPLQITLPQEDEAQAPRVTIVINDVTRYITPIIRSLSKPPKVLIELVLSKSPDTVEVSFSGFYVSSFTYNANQVSAELSMVDYEREPFPMHTFSPKYFPGLF
jgi:hypothetical protein